MAILNKHGRDRGKVAIWLDYKPYGLHKDQGGNSTNYPAHSGRILDLKDDKAGAVDHFADMIEPELSDGIVILTVPSRRSCKPAWRLAKARGTTCTKGQPGGRFRVSRSNPKNQQTGRWWGPQQGNSPQKPFSAESGLDKRAKMSCCWTMSLQAAIRLRLGWTSYLKREHVVYDAQLSGKRRLRECDL